MGRKKKTQKASEPEQKLQETSQGTSQQPPVQHEEQTQQGQGRGGSRQSAGRGGGSQGRSGTSGPAVPPVSVAPVQQAQAWQRAPAPVQAPPGMQPTQQQFIQQQTSGMQPLQQQFVRGQAPPGMQTPRQQFAPGQAPPHSHSFTHQTVPGMQVPRHQFVPGQAAPGMQVPRQQFIPGQAAPNMQVPRQQFIPGQAAANIQVPRQQFVPGQTPGMHPSQQQSVQVQAQAFQSPQGSPGFQSATQSPPQEQQYQGRGRGHDSRGRGGQRGRGGRCQDDQSREQGSAATGTQEYQGGQSTGQGGPGRGQGGPGRGQGGRGGRGGHHTGQQEAQESGPGAAQHAQSPPPATGGQGDRRDIQTAISQIKLSGSGDYHIQEKIPDCGKTGRQIAIYTNHFPLKIGKVKRVIHYDINIDPNRPKKMMKDVYLLCRNSYFNGYNPAFDGNKNIMSATELPFGDEVSGSVSVEEPNSRPKEFKITIKKVNVIDLEDIDRFFNQVRSRRVKEAPMSAIQAIDIVLRHSLLMNNINVGRSFFTPPQNGIIDLGNGMEMYRGFFQSVSLGWKPYLNVDVANKAFPIAKNVIDLIKVLCNSDGSRPLERWNVETLQKYLKNLRVEYNLPNMPSARKRYRVNGVDEPSNILTFKLNDNPRPITVADYYKTDKKCPLRYPNMPTLWVGGLNSEIKVRIPCELCTILPGQAVNRKLDPNQTREMIKQCATNTNVRKDSISQSIRAANYNQDPVVRAFDLQISNDFAKIDARVLIPPILTYNGNKTVMVRKGTWNAEAFFNPATLSSWTILNTDYRTRDDGLTRLEEMVIKIGNRLGVKVPPATKPFHMIKYDPRKMLEQLKDYFAKQKGKTQLIFVVIPEMDRIYNYVKQAAEIAVGCLTQCIKSKTVFAKMNDATVTNILLKVNAKLNGLNHFLKDRPPIMNVPTMLMGADVTHPSPDARDIPSFAAVTASHDPKAFKYNICWRLQPPTVEIIADLENITREHLMFFYLQTKTQPQRIIFYRDGVSNGQFEQVLNAELQAIRRACSKLSPTYKPSITFIVVQKRHHTRFFPVNPRDSEDRNFNVPAGTCVDTEITHPTRQNFFLVSHASIQGVAKPTKYVTLWDDNDFKTEDLENLTYYLCHMFARCTRSVSYPAPTYYAHLAAARAKVYCETEHLNMDRLDFEQTRVNIQKCIVKDLPMFFV